jgi:gas vesicle protein
MRAFLLGLVFGVGVTIGGVVALDLRAPDAGQKVVNWGMLGQKVSSLSPTRYLRN